MTALRAITVKQPWAWAIAYGGKTVENRTRGTAYRGPLAIHAGSAWSTRGEMSMLIAEAWGRYRGLDGPCYPMRDLPTGVILAIAELADAHPDGACCRPWGESEYTEAGGRLRTVVHHFVLEEVRALSTPIPCRGALGLWRVPADIAEEVARG